MSIVSVPNLFERPTKNMDILLSLATTLLAVSLVHGVGEHCSSGGDCGTGECCHSNGGLKGKRATALGVCQRSGHLGDKCFVTNHFAHDGVYYSCPCASGFYCKGSHLVEVPYGEVGQCEKQHEKNDEEQDVSCASGDDCADDECCVSLIRPLGKRKRSPNVCRKLGDTESHCLVSLGSGKTSHVRFECPCKQGLICHATGQFDIPLGAMGKCK